MAFVFRLQDVVNALKKNYAELEENTRLEIQKLTNQVIKAHKSILDLVEKSNRFTSINDNKYMQIWDINAKGANELLDKVCKRCFLSDINIEKEMTFHLFRF